MATAALPMPGGGVAATLRHAESQAVDGGGNGGWTYTGGSDDNVSKIKTKGSAKKKIAAIILTALLGGGAAFLGSSNSLLGPAISNLYTEATDTQYTSASIRSRNILQRLISGDDIAVNTTLWKKQSYGGIPRSFANRLSKQGITIEGKGKNKILKFETTNATGEKIIKDIPASEFRKTLNEDIEFRQAYSSAKRGRVATFFDNVADKVYNRLGLSRNLFNNYRQTSDTDTNDIDYQRTMSSKLDSDVSVTDRAAIEKTGDDNKPIQAVDKDGQLKFDADGNPINEADVIATSTNTSKVDASSAKVKATDMVNSLSKLGQVADGACGIMKITSTIGMMVAAMEIAQSINYFMGDIENISKMQAGYGDASAINSLLNKLSTPATATVTDYSKVKLSPSFFEEKVGKEVENEESSVETITLPTKSPLESNGMQYILGGAPSDREFSGLFSLERIFKSIYVMSGTAITTCSITAITTSAISIISDVLTFGGKSIVTGVLKILGAAAVAITVSSVLAFVIPTIAETFFMNIFGTVTGIEIGEIFTRGAAASNTRIGRSGSGQSLSSEATANLFGKATQEVIAFDAEVERLTHSPFDITNKNTFFGSIAYSLLPVLTTSKTTSIASFIRSTAKSIGNIVSPVKASGEGSSYMTTYGDCPILDEIGAVGDMYCNPITVTDPTTLDIELDDNTYTETVGSQLTEDGKIKANSPLANYINYCANRESPFGVPDQGILDAMALTGDASPTASAILNSLPLLGDFVTIIESAQNTENMGWATGAKCVSSSENSDWETYKYYQRYIEDSRILEEMDVIDENPVTAYYDKYLEEHPLDNSTSGILARMTGSSKEDIETAIAFLDYYMLLNEYDPTVRIAMSEPLLTEKTGTEVATEIKASHFVFRSNNIVDESEPMLVAEHYIVYETLRNRSYTV